MGTQGIRQHAIGICQTLTNDKLGKTDAISLEEFLEIAQSDAVTGRDCGNVEICFVEMRGDVCLDGLQPRRPNAANPRKLCSIGCRSEGQGSEIIDVGSGGLL